MEVIENNSHIENTGKDQTVQKEILPKEIIPAPEHPAHQQKIPDGTNMPAATFEKSELRLVTDRESRLRQVNEQIHYTGQYLANKSVYSQFLKSKNKGQFRQEHSAKLALYEAAVKFLKEKSSDGKLPNLQTLKAEKEKLLVQKKEAQEKYYYYRDYQKELNTVCANIHAALGQVNSRPVHQREPENIS